MNFFKKKLTVDSVMADIVLVVEQLHLVAADQAALADKYEADLVRIADLQQLADNEASRARAVAEKFTALIA